MPLELLPNEQGKQAKLPENSREGFFQPTTGQAGLRKIEIELEGKPEETRRYSQKYRDLVASLVKILKDDMKIKPHEEERFIMDLCGLMYSNLKIVYGTNNQDTLSEALESGKWDCSNTAFLAFDVGKQLGIRGLEMLGVSGHVFIKTENFGFETTSESISACYFPITDLPKRYPTIYFSSPNTYGELQAISYVNRAHFKDALGDPKGAIDDIRMAVKLNPGLALVYTGYLKCLLGDYKGAIEDCNAAIGRNPKIAEIYEARGHAKYCLSDYKGAIEDCNAAINLNQEFANAYRHRGHAKYCLGDYKEAIDDYLRVMILTTKIDATLFLDFADAEKGLGDYKKAMKHYGDAIEYEPSPHAYVGRASAKIGLKEYKGAIDDCNRAIELDPKNAGAYIERSNAKLKLGDFEGAKKDTEACKRLLGQQ